MVKKGSDGSKDQDEPLLESFLAQLGDGASATTMWCKLLVHSMADGFSLLDREGRHIFVNPALCAMTGFSKEELLDTKPPYKYWPPEHTAAIQKALTETLSGNPREFDLNFMDKNGSRFPVMVNPSLIRNRAGDVLGFSATVKDMTARVESSLALEAAHQRMRLHVKKTPMAVIDWDADFRVRLWNPAAEKIFGYTAAEAMGCHGAFIIPKQSRHLVDQVWAGLMARSGGERSTNENVRKDGKIILCEWYNTPLIDSEGRVTGASSLAMDVTDRVQQTRDLERRVSERTRELEVAMEEIVQRNLMLRSLAIKISDAENSERRRIATLLHDHYQQLLVAARMKTEMIHGKDGNPDTRTASRQILNILDEALEASRSLTMELDPPILSTAGLEVAFEWLGRWMKEHHEINVSLRVDTKGQDIPNDIKSLLFHSTRELLFNVAKHAGTKQAEVALSFEGNGFKVSVTDHGRGFAVDEKIKTPRSFGLFNIRERLALVGGHMDLSSASGEGTVITLFVPIMSEAKIPPEQPQAQATASRVADPHEEDRVRILVADDHTVVRQGLIQILQTVPGIEIIGEAVHGQEAVDMALSLHPDIILMDITMPKLSGLEATRQITSRLPGIRIIGLSMHEKEEMKQTLIMAGACDYLSKNSPLEEIVGAIRQAVSAPAS